MGAGHGSQAASALYVPRHSPIHQLAAELKITATVALTVIIVATPREYLGIFAGYGVITALVALVARIPARWLAVRSLIELPFVAAALVLPFVTAGPTVRFAGLDLATDGLWAGWNILIKGTLGVLLALLLAATTRAPDLLAGLDRLRVPQVITQIAMFMLRYLDLLVDEAWRMRIARLSRLDDPRFFWQLRGFAAGLGALFLRSYERGERVYLAMQARGFSGKMPDFRELP